MADFQNWKQSVLGQVLDTDGVKADTDQCVQVANSWAEAIYPGVSWSKSLGSVTTAADLAEVDNKYFVFIDNNHSDVNQLPLQSDIMVFGPTPDKGYSDTYANPDGHCGVCDSASSTGFTLVQENAPNFGEAVNDTSYGWHVIPCLGWLRATALEAPAPVAATAPTNSINVGKTLTLPSDNGKDTGWDVYHVTGPYNTAAHIGVLDPAKYGGEKFVIQKDLGNGIFVIDTEDFGQVAIWTKATDATIS